MLPPRTDLRWKALVEHPERYSYDFLALKIMMQRISLKGGPSMTPQVRDDAIDEVMELFQTYGSIMDKDIAAIFG